MELTRLPCILLLLLIIPRPPPTSGTVLPASWSHELDLEEESGIRFRWRNTLEDEMWWLVMEVSARTRGYVGVGFSPHGGMDGGDIALGWVDDRGGSHLQDYHGVGNAEPILDESQDYELISAKEDGEWTTVRFTRRWDTCDRDGDMQIVKDTMRLIWAYSPYDPKLDDNNGTVSMRWHGTTTRGAVSVYIVDDVFPTKFPEVGDPHVKTWDMLMSDNLVEAEHTTYFCKIIKLPELKGKHQMIAVKPLLSPENKKNVHHIVFYECMIPAHHGRTEDVFEKHVGGGGGRCYTKNMPPEWAQHCATFLFAWVSGSEGDMLPEHVGSPLGEEHGGATYFMLEIHYDNPELRTFKDSSGVRIFYTDKLRPNDGSMLLLGYRITPFLLLPPQQDNFKTFGICSAQCTQNTFPEDGINVIVTMVHGHVSLRKIRLRHFRGGVELPVVAEDDHYDFNYQQSRTLKNEIKILRGDELMVECEYDTTANGRVVLGGLSTKQEMCQTFLMYYPRIDLMQCTSQYEFHDFFKGIGLDNVSGSVLRDIGMPIRPELLSPYGSHCFMYRKQREFDSPDDAKELEESGDGASYRSMFDHIAIEAPERLRGSTVGDYLKNVNWSDQGVGKGVEERWRTGRHYAYCTGNGRRRVQLENHVIPYPDIVKPLVRRDKEGCDARLVGSSGVDSAFGRLNSFILLISVGLCTYFQLAG